mmetsp:Transcript_36717/g.110209  ORF Transcript_36717/g.110209 Transcript_36717/m.110209 type:complete len:130 (-) Transcript_36717:40-429(-)
MTSTRRRDRGVNVKESHFAVNISSSRIGQTPCLPSNLPKGANGFIGSHCVLALLLEGLSVMPAVRNLSNPRNTDFLKDGADKLGDSDRLTFAKGNLYSGDGYDDAFEGCRGVLHTDAVVGIGDAKDTEN